MDSKILIVDDDPTIREVMCELIEGAGYQVISAPSGQEAIALLKSESVEVAIVDILMPEMDGLELTQVIKKESDADVIVMTGFGGQYTYQDAIYKGASDFILKPVRLEELVLRIKRVLRERQMTKEHQQMLRQLEQLAVTDELTKLYNLRHFYKQLELEAGRSNRYGRPLSLLLFDIDQFKRYNDLHGHIEGDKVLARIADVTRSCVRETDVVCRYGGEEFTVILPEIGGEEALRAGHRVREAIAAEVFSPRAGDTIHVLVSVGVTQYHLGEEITFFVKRADMAMYGAKRAGGNQVCYLAPSSNVASN